MRVGEPAIDLDELQPDELQAPVLEPRDDPADEQPLHPVWLSAYWLSETPVSWADYCRLMQWQGPPAGVPDGEAAGDLFLLHNENKIRRQYCGTRIGEEDGDQTSTRSIAPGGAGTPEWRFDLKPMVSAGCV